MVSYFVYLAVIVCGASVLAVEILGTRIIAPFYGSGLYLWSALISVTLAALGAGYAVGGRWADRHASLARFCAIIGLAGLWIAIVPWLKVPVLALAGRAGLRLAVLITSTILFFPPLALLGMVSPYAIRLQAPSLEVVGRTAGNLYAVSTFASVAAALATGFLLIPHVGVYRLVLLIGLALIATALLGFAVEHRRKAGLAAIPILAAGIFLALRAAPAHTEDPARGVIAVEQSAYGEIRVVDWEGTRNLIMDGGTHSIVDSRTGESLAPYVHVVDIVKEFFAQAGDMLLLGLGSGSVARSFSRDGWQVDAVEIDPVVTRVARRYFGFDSTKADVYEMDARRFLLSHRGTYDVIIMDAFGSSSIPFHLVTAEAFGLIRSHLAPQGILAVNVEAVGWQDVVVRSIATTARRHFDHVLVLPIAEPPDQMGNLVLLASNREINLDLDLPAPDDRFSPEYDRVHAWDNRFEVPVAGNQVLTDELNPVEVWSERVNLAARRELHAVWSGRGVAW
jgi:predicted membrane-bound spermidine synthase